MKGKLKQTEYITLFLLVIIIALVIIYWQPITKLFSEKENIQNFISNFGILAPIGFILIQIFQIIIAPIPAYLTWIAGGYIFGWFWGSIYSLLGLTLGSIIVFYLVKIFGRPLVLKLIPEKIFKKFDYLTEKKGVLIFFIIFLLPFFPDDIICYAAGLTKIPILSLVIIAFLGRFPVIIISNIIGDNILNLSKTSWGIITFIISIIFLVIFYIYHQKILKFMHNKLKGIWRK